MTAAVYALDPLKDLRHRDAAAARDLADWLRWLELGNKAARTLDTYERTVAVLLRSFPNTEFGEFTDGDLMHVLAMFPPRSRHINKAALNSWFKWGYKSRRISGNPVDLLPEIKYRQNRSYDLFTPAETEALCALPTPDGQLLTLMFWTGLRRSECRFLTGKRLDLAHQQVVVVEGAKGSKQRRVPMIDPVAHACAELLTLEGIGPDGYLWYSRPGGGRRVKRERPIANATFDIWWKRVLKQAGVRHRNPHMTRHTFATRLFEAGMRDKDVQLMLGHESSRTTVDTYQHADLKGIGERLREAVGELV